MTPTDTLARHEAKTEPPKRWRNRWLVMTARIGGRCTGCTCGRPRAPRLVGDDYTGCRSFASEEEAMAHAAEETRRKVNDDIYLGPIPEPSP